MTDKKETKFFTALSLGRVETIHKDEIAKLLRACADWIELSANDRIGVTFKLEFSEDT